MKIEANLIFNNVFYRNIIGQFINDHEEQHESKIVRINRQWDVNSCLLLSDQKYLLLEPAQILDETDCVSLHANALEKIVGQNGFFSLSKATNRGKGKLWFPCSIPPLKKWPCAASCTWYKGWVNICSNQLTSRAGGGQWLTNNIKVEFNVIDSAFCLSATHSRMNGTPNETRTHSWKVALLVNYFTTWSDL